MKFKIVVVGGGTAGVMAATYFRAYWGDLADITIIYDHKKPGIGVGESLTPIFDNYLKAVGVTTHDLIKHCNATIKLGLRFTKWADENSVGWHSFPHNEAWGQVDQVLYDFCAVDAYDIINDQYDGGYNYSTYYIKNNSLPSVDDTTYRHALHVDATILSKFVLDRYRSALTVIDGVVNQVEVENNSIKSIQLEDGRQFTADMFIDASGFERVLFKNLEAEWVDTSKYLPTNRTIPNPIFKEFNTLPCYTTAEASKNGWILDVPLSNRRGTGYTYCSEFTSDEEAKQEFNKWLIQTHGVELASDRVLKFSTGYYKQEWVGNCVCIGLASSFVEPLEATNLHHTWIQLDMITRLYSGRHTQFNQKSYNDRMTFLLEDSFRYIRWFYHTGRQDSDFWKYMSNNVPDYIKDMEILIAEGGYLTKDHFVGTGSFMFEAADYNIVAYYNNHYKNLEGIWDTLTARHLYEHAGRASKHIRDIKTRYQNLAVDHKKWINYIKEQK
jgi:tryptophan halogenase